MMLGTRGETEKTFHESLRFLEHAQPNSYIFSCLSIYPGTDDYATAVAEGRVDPEVYFTGTFQELKMPFDASAKDAALMNSWFTNNRGVRSLHQPDVAELQQVLQNLGEHHAAHLDLAEALVEADRLELAEQHLDRALKLGSPVPGLVLNVRACIAAKRRDYARVKELLVEAARIDPQHYLLLKNAATTKAWFQALDATRTSELELEPRHDFLLFERTEQPTLPGPLPINWADWSEPSVISPRAPEQRRTHQDSANLKVLPILGQ
jgi:anaerobic magnesium-protoporphyrin IX monomethyl ester cyclase